MAIRISYQNWHANLPAKTVTWHSPASVRSVSNVLRACSTEGARLLTLGQGMSLSRLVEPGEHVMDPQRFRGVTQLEARHVSSSMAKVPYFRVGAGTYLTELNHVLGLQGWALPTSGAASDQSLAGASSTGTHGAATFGALHDCVQAICLITAPDTAVLVQREPGYFTPELTADLAKDLDCELTVSARVEDFRAAVVGLGAMGVIHSIVIEAEPLFQLVGCRVDRAMTDPAVWEAIREGSYEGLFKRPPQVAADAPPFNIAFTFSPSAMGMSSVTGVFGSFLWKIDPQGPYPRAYPGAHPRMSSPLERWAASISPHLPNGLVAWIVASHYYDGAWDERVPAFPGHVFGPTTIRRNNGRSTEIIVPASQAYDTVRTVLDTVYDHPRKIIGLVGLRFVGATRDALLAMNRGNVACIEVPCLGEDGGATTEVFGACWRAVEALGKPFTHHWGQENSLNAASVTRYFGEDVEAWRDARTRLLPVNSRAVFRNPLTDKVGLTERPASAEEGTQDTEALELPRGLDGGAPQPIVDRVRATADRAVQSLTGMREGRVSVSLLEPDGTRISVRVEVARAPQPDADCFSEGLSAGAASGDQVPQWYRLAEAELGEHEVPGPEANARIQEYLATVGSFTDDETPWCSAFANWVMSQAGRPSTGSAAARSWARYGVGISSPRVGAITVLWRGSPTGWQGHVGFYVGRRGGQVLLLGGNQRDSVCIKSFPERRVLAYRWPPADHEDP